MIFVPDKRFRLFVALRLAFFFFAISPPDALT
jgi:hypothetical protein